MGGYARAFLGPRTWAQSTPRPWNFAINNGGVNKYTNTGLLTPLLTPAGYPLGGISQYPNSNNQLCGVAGPTGKVMMTENGWYDFTAGTFGSYTNASSMFSTVTVGGVIYCLYGLPSTGAPAFGSTSDGKTITNIQNIPVVSGSTGFNNQYSRLQFDGTNIVFCAVLLHSSFNRSYWYKTSNLGVSFSNSTQVRNTTNWSSAWIDYAGNQYMYINVSSLYVSTDYFTTSTLLTTTNLGNTGTRFQQCVPMADGVRVYLADDLAEARVIHVDNSASDIVLMSAGSGYFPCIENDRATIYAYDSGIVSSTDFTTWTQLSTEVTITGKVPTFKQSQCVN